MKHELFLKSKIKRIAPFITVGLLSCLNPSVGAFAETGLYHSQSVNQKQRISGIVTDTNGEPLIGVNISIIGKSGGTISDIDGKYSIDVPNGAKLKFTYIGCKDYIVTVGKKSVINVELQEDSESLDEVVVIGYGQATKRDLTGSMAKMDMKEITKAPVASLGDALAGRVAGVVISTSDGQPGSESNIVIRGNSSLTGDNSPLYVIDGFPMESGGLSSLSPSEIESIEILKDASAAAIYGSRGANGVVLVTTKKGKEGRPVVSYEGSYGFQNVSKRMDLMNPYDYVAMCYEFEPEITAERYFQDGRTLETFKGLNGVDFQDAVFRTAVIQNHNLALRGGNSTTKYNVSLNRMDQEGVIINGGFSRTQGRVVLDQQISKVFKFGINTSYSETKQYGVVPSETGYSAGTYVMYDVWGYRPINYDGTVSGLFEEERNPYDDETSLQFNPLQHIENAINDRRDRRLIANAYLEVNLMKNLKMRFSGGITQNTTKKTTFNNSKTKYGNSYRTEKVNGSVINQESDSWLSENTITYDKKWKSGHKLNAVAGFTAQGYTSSSDGARAIQLPYENLGVSGLDLGTPYQITATSGEWKLASFLGRINYNYKYRYLLTVSMRADGSSKFAKGNRWGYFPSGSVAWRISEEKFMKRGALSKVSDAKLRLSIGATGNNRVGDFASLAQMNGTYYFNGTDYSAITPTQIANKDLRWEKTVQTNIGFDFGMFDQRLSLTLDLYRKNTSDLLLNSKLPGSTGYTQAMKNIGKVRNEGLEITLNTVNVQNDAFQWSTNFNISFNRNEVLDLAENQYALTSVVGFDQNYKTVPAYIAIKGQPMAQMIGYVWDGLYQEEDFIKTPTGQYLLRPDVPCNTSSKANEVQPGHIKFKDLNNDGIINSSDMTIIGNPNPKHTGGFSNTFNYKGFDLNVFFQWSYGNDIYNANRLVFESSRINYKNLNRFASFADRWSPENTDATIPIIRGEAEALGAYYASNIVEDGSFLRLKTVSLGYTFPKEWTRKIYMSNLRFHVSAQNLITWTAYSGFDPEVSTQKSALTPGFDFSTYPRAKTIVFGLNATF